MRVGLICVALAAVLAVPIFFVDSLTVDQVFGILSFTLLVIAGLFFAHRLLERLAPAEREEERTHFNPRNPNVPLRRRVTNQRP